MFVLYGISLFLFINDKLSEYALLSDQATAPLGFVPYLALVASLKIPSDIYSGASIFNSSLGCSSISYPSFNK